MAGKECNCGKSKSYQEISKAAKKLRKYVLVSCVNCDDSLQAENGMKYPLHRIPLSIPEKQVEQWEKQGYEFHREL